MAGVSRRWTRASDCTLKVRVSRLQIIADGVFSIISYRVCQTSGTRGLGRRSQQKLDTVRCIWTSEQVEKEKNVEPSFFLLLTDPKPLLGVISQSLQLYGIAWGWFWLILGEDATIKADCFTATRLCLPKLTTFLNAMLHYNDERLAMFRIIEERQNWATFVPWYSSQNWAQMDLQWVGWWRHYTAQQHLSITNVI